MDTGGLGRNRTTDTRIFNLRFQLFDLVNRLTSALTSTPKKKGLLSLSQQQTLICIGAGEMNRTPDLLITNELLYRLSYTGEGEIIARRNGCFA